MPNWVTNRLGMEGSSEDIEKVFETIKGVKFYNKIDFNKIIPMPGNIYRGPIGPEEKEKYGENNWYDWRKKHWGTKWNASVSCIVDGAIYFQTAWATPLPVILELSRMFPNVEFTLGFTNEEWDLGYGEYTIKDNVADLCTPEDKEEFCSGIELTFYNNTVCC